MGIQQTLESINDTKVVLLVVDYYETKEVRAKLCSFELLYENTEEARMNYLKLWVLRAKEHKCLLMFDVDGKDVRKGNFLVLEKGSFWKWVLEWKETTVKLQESSSFLQEEEGMLAFVESIEGNAKSLKALYESLQTTDLIRNKGIPEWRQKHQWYSRLAKEANLNTKEVQPLHEMLQIMGLGKYSWGTK